MQLSWGFSPWRPFQQLRAPPRQVQLTGTNWPDRGLDRHPHTQERKQLDTGQTNFLFSKMWYYHPDTTALFQIHLGSLSRTNSRPCLQVPCKKDKAMQQPPTGIRPPHTHTWAHPSLLRTPLGEAQSYWQPAATHPVYIYECPRLRSPGEFASEISLELRSCSLNAALSEAGAKPSECTA